MRTRTRGVCVVRARAKRGENVMRRIARDGGGATARDVARRRDSARPMCSVVVLYI